MVPQKKVELFISRLFGEVSIEYCWCHLTFFPIICCFFTIPSKQNQKMVMFPYIYIYIYLHIYIYKNALKDGQVNSPFDELVLLVISP